MAEQRRYKRNRVPSKKALDAGTLSEELLDQNRVDVNLLPANNIYLFGLVLLDLYFTKEELSQSLIFPSTKSKKPMLDQEKVGTIIELMKQRFPDEKFDSKKFQEKANQRR
ncbi:hypothetical protein EMCRGX_G014891 [Ephydatia muelleri]